MKAKDNYLEGETIKLIEDYMSDHGYKNTSQRRKILSIFINNQEKHLSAEEIHEKLRSKGIGMATVYRNINTFVKLNILKEFKVEDTNHYELKMYAKKPLHIHFKCDICNSIEDIVDQDIILEYLKLNKLIEEKQDNEIVDVDIMFHGICKDCIEEK